MTKFISLLTLVLFYFGGVFAQTATPVPDRRSEPVQAYPVTNVVKNAALKVFDADFPNTNVGFLHVYTDPIIDPGEVYLFEGTPVSSTTKALLPAKFQRLAKVLNAKLYGAMSIAGVNESLYILRMDGQQEDRLEMFAIRGYKVVHVRTLAYRNCAAGLCTQMDSYLTDLNGNTTLDLVQIKRTQTKSKERYISQRAYTMNPRNRKWKRARRLVVPWDSIKFFEPAGDEH